MSAVITRPYVQMLREALTPLDTPERRARYLAGDYPRAERTKDLSKRYRWDLLWDSHINPTVWDALHEHGVLDAHIDTALRTIVPPLEGIQP